MTAADRVTRFSSDLFDEAVRAGRRENRSARQQLEHWARLGQAVSNQTSAARSRVEAALAGKLPSEQLTHEEAVVFDAEIDTAIDNALPTVDFVKERASLGHRSVTFDDGALVEHLPDGSRRILPGR
ncbi:hypothetical protein GOARA_060_00070 [Gordonia araii NBRC 100433]|uniref:ParD-like antitoxin of type II toxin-antitoxin system n=1 Tax=Gordonia araii NBRC 100433 TaxID=1073574 RepID=G7H3Y1_9ACTN|nr:hypothetical protein [Gordonia araii]NNG98921.1 hypothetical protein [Gordonia araii NBRC 100433]GAB10556.1 hypothetical protein GOARA_060_00070 [Gordonia araii NBRC 100433]